MFTEIDIFSSPINFFFIKYSLKNIDVYKD